MTDDLSSKGETLKAWYYTKEEHHEIVRALTSEMTLAMFLDCGGDMPTDEPAP